MLVDFFVIHSPHKPTCLLISISDELPLLLCKTEVLTGNRNFVLFGEKRFAFLVAGQEEFHESVARHPKMVEIDACLFCPQIERYGPRKDFLLECVVDIDIEVFRVGTEVVGSSAGLSAGRFDDNLELILPINGNIFDDVYCTSIGNRPFDTTRQESGLNAFGEWPLILREFSV